MTKFTSPDDALKERGDAVVALMAVRPAHALYCIFIQSIVVASSS